MGIGEKEGTVVIIKGRFIREEVVGKVILILERGQIEIIEFSELMGFLIVFYEEVTIKGMREKVLLYIMVSLGVINR